MARHPEVPNLMESMCDEARNREGISQQKTVNIGFWALLTKRVTE
jgi:hypothetical protein